MNRAFFTGRCTAFSLVLLVLLALGGCAGGISPNAVVPNKERLQGYKTYALDDSAVVGAFVSRDPSLQPRLHQALHAALASRGLVHDAQRPDVVVSVAVGVQHKRMEIMDEYGVNARTGLRVSDLALEDGALVFSLRLTQPNSEEQVGFVSLRRSGQLESLSNPRLRAIADDLLNGLGW